MSGDEVRLIDSSGIRPTVEALQPAALKVVERGEEYDVLEVRRGPPFKRVNNHQARYLQSALDGWMASHPDGSRGGDA